MPYIPFSATMSRLALRPFTFSNGVTVPAGTLIVVPGGILHRDGEIYPNPEEFDGFRFSKLRERDGDDVARHQALSTSADHVNFGYGRHAWWFFGLPRSIAVTHISLPAQDGSLRSTKSRLYLHTSLSHMISNSRMENRPHVAFTLVRCVSWVRRT